MNWFKHDSNSTMDSKIKKLIIRYGAIGYAIYFHCLELIAECVNENNITFELEHDSEIIADDLRIHGDSEKSGREIVEEIMKFMIELNLFEENNGHIFCFKLLKRLDTSMTSNPKMRALITSAKQNHDTVMINHDTVMINQGNIMQEKKRIEKKRIDKIYSPEVINLTQLLYSECQRIDSRFKRTDKQLKSWSADIEKINRIDGYSWSEIETVILWAKADSFWYNNIQSGSKLREKFSQLFPKARDSKNRTSKPINLENKIQLGEWDGQ